MNTKNNLLYCVTFYDEDGNCFDQEIYASNEDDLMDILDSYEYDVVDYGLIQEDK